MFNLNENNQFLISNAPIDMRVGVNEMCGKPGATLLTGRSMFL
ncbi:MAG: hypothetical protein PUI88_00420 [Prevotella sp.]|nr:hypothetical protein [Prevotella sp.]